MDLKAVILAAGCSSRMGRPKQLLKVQGRSMLDHAVAAAVEAGLGRPVLVLGAFYDRILQESALAKQCEIVRNTDFEQGQATSLVAGVRQVMYRCDGVVFMLCDQPFVRGSLLAELTRRFITKKPDLLYPVYRRQRGNPVVISSRLFPRLLTATGDSGARFLFNDPEFECIPYEVDDQSVIMDIDTPEEYEAVKRPAS